MGFDEVFESRHSQVLIMMKRPESGGLKVFCIIADKLIVMRCFPYADCIEYLKRLIEMVSVIAVYNPYRIFNCHSLAGVRH